MNKHVNKVWKATGTPVNHVYTVSFTVLQAVVCTVACIKHVWYFDICNRTYNTHEVYTVMQSVLIPVVSLGRCDWLIAAGCRRPPQAVSSCWLVGDCMNIIRAAILYGGFLEYRRMWSVNRGNSQMWVTMEVGSQRLRKAWAAFGCVKEDCVNAGQRIQFTLHESH